VEPLWNLRATAIVTLGRYAASSSAERIMKREFSSDHIHYDPVSGYIHKFRLEGEDDAREIGEIRDTEQGPDLSLIIAMWIAAGLLVVIGALTL
jgi:hypothetical protein